MDPLEGVNVFTPPFYIDPLLTEGVLFGTVVYYVSYEAIGDILIAIRY